MKKNEKGNKYIPFKNYIYAILFLIIVILIVWYFLSWYKIKQEEKYINSYLISSGTLSLEIKDLDEIVQVLKESPSEYFVFITYNNDENTYKLEKRLKLIIDDYGLKDEFYYINVTNLKESSTLYNELNDAFSTTMIKNVPCLLYFKSDELEKIIIDEKKIFNADDVIKLLDEYDYEKISQ